MTEDKNTKTMGDDVFYTVPRIMDFFSSIKEFDGYKNLYIEHRVIERLTIYAYCWYLGLKGKRLFREGITAVHIGFFYLLIDDAAYYKAAILNSLMR
jgi:hypothetical protein